MIELTDKYNNKIYYDQNNTNQKLDNMLYNLNQNFINFSYFLTFTSKKWDTLKKGKTEMNKLIQSEKWKNSTFEDYKTYNYTKYLIKINEYNNYLTFKNKYFKNKNLTNYTKNQRLNTFLNRIKKKGKRPGIVKTEMDKLNLKEQSKISYFGVWEQHKNGIFHCHVISNKPYNMIGRVGDVQPIINTKIFRYILKYITKENFDPKHIFTNIKQIYQNKDLEKLNNSDIKSKLIFKTVIKKNIPIIFNNYQDLKKNELYKKITIITGEPGT